MSNEKTNDDQDKYKNAMNKMIEFIETGKDCHFIFMGYNHDGELILAGGEMTVHHTIGLVEHLRMRMLERLSNLVGSNIDSLLKNELAKIYAEAVKLEADQAVKQ
jgi:hypothetical protein